MILDTDIHNFYEHLVLKEIERQGLNLTLNANQMADLCCLTLNQLPSHYIQGEIVNILLKIKNSFLPTKQILIGL
ncbi:late competence development ComFB family protein [Aeromonas salmonicida]|uniref:late competence development ComFB family protein n=1 Tax=Aeromonas salmonicida TaxID=645 RepID=UPI001412DF61|nr:late competence development ComFB family protein [Aeromonas salmonicida]